jgi:predicted RNase H-like nuclease (RuvC/YqgF family)
MIRRLARRIFLHMPPIRRLYETVDRLQSEHQAMEILVRAAEGECEYLRTECERLRANRKPVDCRADGAAADKEALLGEVRQALQHLTDGVLARLDKLEHRSD